MSSQSIYPALRYRDPDAAVAWLKEAIGATEQAVHRDEAGGVAHAELVVEGQLIMLGEAREDFLGGSTGDARASTISLYVAVADPDAHHDRAAAAGADVVRPIEDMDYGSREYSLRDIEGNLWSFGTYRPQADTGS